MVERVLIGPGGATEETLLEVLTAVQSESRINLDYTGGPTAKDPVYIGIAPPAALPADATWLIRKLSYVGGEVASIELRSAMAWDDRATPTPGWD